MDPFSDLTDFDIEHVFPAEDLFEHEDSKSCPCRPEYHFDVFSNYGTLKFVAWFGHRQMKDVRPPDSLPADWS